MSDKRLQQIALQAEKKGKTRAKAAAPVALPPAELKRMKRQLDDMWTQMTDLVCEMNVLREEIDQARAR